MPLTVEPLPLMPLTVEPLPLMPLTVEPLPLMPLTAEPLPLMPLTVEPLPLMPLTVEPLPLMPLTVEPLPLMPLTVEPLPLMPLTVEPLPLMPLTVEPVTLMPLTVAPLPLIPAKPVDAAPVATSTTTTACPNVFIDALPIAIGQSAISSCGLAPRERRFLPGVPQHDSFSRGRSLLALLALGRWTGPRRNRPPRHISFLYRFALMRPGG